MDKQKTFFWKIKKKNKDDIESIIITLKPNDISEEVGVIEKEDEDISDKFTLFVAKF